MILSIDIFFIMLQSFGSIIISKIVFMINLKSSMTQLVTIIMLIPIVIEICKGFEIK